LRIFRFALFLALLFAAPSLADVVGVAYGRVLQVSPNYLGGGCRIEVFEEHQSTIDFPALPKFDKACSKLLIGDQIVVSVVGRVGAIQDGYPVMTFTAIGKPSIVSP